MKEPRTNSLWEEVAKIIKGGESEMGNDAHHDSIDEKGGSNLLYVFQNTTSFAIDGIMN